MIESRLALIVYIIMYMGKLLTKFQHVGITGWAAAMPTVGQLGSQCKGGCLSPKFDPITVMFGSYYT